MSETKYRKMKLVRADISLHIVAAGLLAIGLSNWDGQAPVRGWAAEYIGNGVNIGGDNYTISQDHIEVDGKAIQAIRLTVRRNFFDNDPSKQPAPEEHWFPFDQLRVVDLSCVMAVPVDA